MSYASADLDEHLWQVREADLEYEERRQQAIAELRDTLVGFYIEAGGYSYPSGSFFDHLVDEAAVLRDQFEPRSREPRAKKRRISNSTRKRIFERDGYRCVRCGSWIDLTIDHKIPESRGGTDEDANLQTMCRPCNTSKGTAE